MAKTKILFCGTAEFAWPALQQLLQNDAYELSGVITQPDRPVGRGGKLTPPAIKSQLIAAGNTTHIFQPEKLRLEVDSILEQTQPELIIVAAYGQFVPKSMLEYPQFGCLNIHASLLPQLRGAVPIPMAILQGLEKTGVTIQLMAEGMDAGDILAQREFGLTEVETTATLTTTLSELGANLLLDTLPQWVSGEIKPTPQDESAVTFCYQRDIGKDQAQIKFETPIALATRMVRAFHPWPIAWAEISYQSATLPLKIYQALSAENLELPLATELTLKRVGKSLYLGLSDGWLELVELQIPGKQRMPVENYLFLASNSAN
jgi:methionyl-tRNA formyltransferase